MVAGVRAHYGLQGGITGLTMVVPGSAVATDKGVIYTVNKNSSVDPTDPGGGWSRLGSAQLGTGIDGVGTGKIRFTAWETEFVGTPGNTAITFTGANRCLGGGTVFSKDIGDVWATTLISFGEDIVSDTTFAAQVAANLGMRVGDFLLSFGAFTDVVSLVGRGITIPGITSSITNVDSAGGAVGNKIFVWTDYRKATAGAQSGAATTNATAGTATTGGAVHLQVGLASLALPLGAASGANTAQGLSLTKAQTLGAGAETDAAQSVGLSKAQTLAAAVETDAAQPLTLTKALGLGAAAGAGVAQAMAYTKQLLLGVPHDAATAPPLALLKALGLGRALEADSARPVDMSVPAVDFTPARQPIASNRPGDRTASTRTTNYTAVTRSVAGSASTREG